jgi:hypothetical protein
MASITNKTGKGDLQMSEQKKNRLSGGFDYGTIRYSKPIGPVNQPKKTAEIDIRGYLGDERTGIRKTGVGMRKSVAQRMEEYSQKQLAKIKSKAPAAAKPKAPARKPTQINVPGGGLRTAKSSGGVMSASQARSMAPGNYSKGKVSMGGKTYTGFTVSSRTDSKGRTTKSVGNWTSTPNAGRSFGKNDVAGPTKNAAGKNASSMTGKKK